MASNTLAGKGLLASASTSKITGLTGDLAIQKAGKNTRKKLLEEQKREEFERQALKERI